MNLPIHAKRVTWAGVLLVLGGVLPAHTEAAPQPWEDFVRDVDGAGRGGVVVDHPPRRVGGVVSDTAFYDRFGRAVWQRLADDVVLAAPAIIRQASRWGFFGDCEQSHEPPTGAETMRIRFYDARPGDGLPGVVLYEEAFVNPSRTATGEVVFGACGLPDEYVYEVDLSTPVALEADTPYWFEVAQVGDVDSTFLMELSETDLTGMAYISSLVPQWQHGFTVDLAFQLSTIPEPGALGLFTLGLILAGKRST